MRRCRAKPTPNSGLSLTAPPLAPCHPPSDSVLSFSPSRFVFVRGRFSEERKQAGNGRKGKNNEIRRVKNKTNEAVSYVLAALESGQSDILTQDLNAMARFHNYSFGNIMLIARQESQ